MYWHIGIEDSPVLVPGTGLLLVLALLGIRVLGRIYTRIESPARKQAQFSKRRKPYNEGALLCHFQRAVHGGMAVHCLLILIEFRSTPPKPSASINQV